MSKNTNETKKQEPARVDNIYRLEGRVPLASAIPFGLQHILAMFVANIAPVMIVAGACGLAQKDMAMLIQCAMIIAGLGTMIQLYPIWKIGSGLPIVMGISFTFVSIFCFVGATYGYGAVVGAVIVGGVVEGILEKNRIPYCGCNSGNCHWFFPFKCGRNLLRRWKWCRRFWFGKKSIAWNHNFSGVPCV
jgi:hypothetical protein